MTIKKQLSTSSHDLTASHITACMSYIQIYNAISQFRDYYAAKEFLLNSVKPSERVALAKRIMSLFN